MEFGFSDKVSDLRTRLLAFMDEHVYPKDMLDRLLHHATVVVTDGESYRMKEARARRGVREKKT